MRKPLNDTYHYSPAPLEVDAALKLELDKLFSDTYGANYPLNIIKPNDRYADTIKFFTVRHADGSLAGCCGAQTYISGASVHISLSRLVRHHTHRKAGIGKGLLSAVKDWATQSFGKQETLLTAECLSSNQSSIRLFEALGFSINCIWHESRENYLDGGAQEREYVDYMQLSCALSGTAFETVCERFSAAPLTQVADEFSSKTSTALVFATTASDLSHALTCCQRYLKAGVVPAILTPFSSGDTFAEANDALTFGGIFLLRGAAYDFLSVNFARPWVQNPAVVMPA